MAATGTWQVMQTGESPPLGELTVNLTRHLLKEDTVTQLLSPKEKGLSTIRKINDRSIGKVNRKPAKDMIFNLKPQGQ